MSDEKQQTDQVGDNPDMPPGNDNMSAEQAEHGEAEATEQPHLSLDEALEENAALKDKLLRALADVENIRQRTVREVEDARRYAISGFARDLLDVADNMRRALDNAPSEPEDPSLKNLVEGVALTERSLLAAFEKAKITRVVPERGDQFDHKQHQAMFEVPTDEMEPGRIAEVMQSGYVIADRLLRPALVGVTRKAPGDAGSGGDAAGKPGATVDTQA